MSKTFFDPQESLGFMTITANRLLCAMLRRQMTQAGLDLTAEQWGALVHIWNHNGISQDDATTFACVDKSSMSRVLAAMERRGLITRQPDPADARRKIILPTPKSLAIKERSRDVAQGVLDLALREVSPEDRATCLRVLGQVKQALLQAGANPQTLSGPADEPGPDPE